MFVTHLPLWMCLTTWLNIIVLGVGSKLILCIDFARKFVKNIRANFSAIWWIDEISLEQVTRIFPRFRSVCAYLVQFLFSPLDKFTFAVAIAFSVLLVLRQLERLNQTKVITTADQKKGTFLSELKTTQGKINPTAKSAGNRVQPSQRGKTRAIKSARENAGN